MDSQKKQTDNTRLARIHPLTANTLTASVQQHMPAEQRTLLAVTSCCTQSNNQTLNDNRQKLRRTKAYIYDPPIGQSYDLVMWFITYHVMLLSPSRPSRHLWTRDRYVEGIYEHSLCCLRGVLYRVNNIWSKITMIVRGHHKRHNSKNHVEHKWR